DKNYFLYFLKTDFFLKQMYMYRTGAAIPNVSDKDLSDILIYLPKQKEIAAISKKVKTAVELREQSKKMIDEIELEMI
ncbi:MAG: restriction endonuclease subunit S, partial [Bacteroidota bacterium]